jgi:hypothetical protein
MGKWSVNPGLKLVQNTGSYDMVGGEEYLDPKKGRSPLPGVQN